MPISVSRYAPVKRTREDPSLEIVLWEDVTCDERRYEDYRTAQVVMVEYQDLLEAQRILQAAARQCPDLEPQITALLSKRNF